MNIEKKNEVKELKRWAIENNIADVHVDKLLLILRVRLLPELPKTSKTFFKTNKDYEFKSILHNDGTSKKYVYFSIEDGLNRCFNAEIHDSNVIQVQINIDGLPLYKSSCKTFWPILCKIYNPKNDIYKPLPVVIYASKVTDTAPFLEDFIEEVNLLHKNGITIDDGHYSFSIHSFICDTLARALLKAVKGHSGFYRANAVILGYIKVIKLPFLIRIKKKKNRHNVP